MAVMNLDFYSSCLKMSTLVTVIVPDSVRIGDIPVSQRKCLYLLHGLSDDATSALRLSKVELYAQETGIVVVMPSVGRSMYCDNVMGQNYFSHVAQELPHYLHMILGLSQKKENNFIAGISMGGMGAAKVALTYPERFSTVGLFSGLLELKMMLPRMDEKMRNEFPFLAEAADDIDHTPLNPINLLDAQKHQNLSIIIRCGKEDDLYPMSLAFYQKALGLGLPVTATFGDGGHVWRVWDGYLDDFIAMIAEETAGV